MGFWRTEKKMTVNDTGDGKEVLGTFVVYNPSEQEFKVPGTLGVGVAKHGACSVVQQHSW